MPTDALIIRQILRLHGPLTTKQILQHYPEVGGTTQLKKILNPIWNLGEISKRPVEIPDAAPSAKRPFLWMLPEEAQKLDDQRRITLGLTEEQWQRRIKDRKRK